MSGHLQLQRWMQRAKLNQVHAAELIGIGYWHFNKIYLGVRLPGRDVAVQIEQKTGIPVEAWVSSEMDNSLRSTGTHGRK